MNMIIKLIKYPPIIFMITSEIIGFNLGLGIEIVFVLGYIYAAFERFLSN